ncbi:MAG: hypothetical protein ACYDHP_00645 [Ferrimicrobium sp.]
MLFDLMVTLAEWIGILVIVLGVWLIYPPAAIIVLGIGLIVESVSAEWTPSERPKK